MIMEVYSRGGCCYLTGALYRGEGFVVVGVQRVWTQFTLQENLLAAGVAPNSERGQVDCQVVPRLLRTHTHTHDMYYNTGATTRNSDILRFVFF